MQGLRWLTGLAQAAGGGVASGAGGGEPPPIFGYDRVRQLLDPTLTDTPWWHWGALLLCLFVGVIAGKIALTVLRNIGDRLDQHRWPIRAVTFRSLAGPANLVGITLGLYLGLRVFLYPFLDPTLVGFFDRTVLFLLLFAAGWALFNLVDVIDLALRNVTHKTDSKLDDMVVPLVRKTLRIFLVLVFTLAVAQNVLGLNITGWLAGLGIAGLAVSLAAQDSLKNLFGSVTVCFDKPFVIGHRIKFDGFDGVVEEIGFRSTRIRTLEGHCVTVPNMKFIDNSVENVGLRPAIRRVMNVTITYDTPPDKIDQAVHLLREILTSQDVAFAFDMNDSPPRVSFNELNADSLNIVVFYWYTLADGRDYWSYLDHCQLVNRKLFRAYAQAGIDFAFPTRTLYLAGDAKRALRVDVQRGAESE